MTSRHGDSARALSAAQLETQIIERVHNGMTFREIAADLDYSKSYVHKVFVRAIRKDPEKAVETYRVEQLARIQMEREVLLNILADSHLVVSQGHVVSEIVGHFPVETELGEPHPKAGEPIYGEPLEDPAPVMAAIDRLHKLDDQEMKLTGGYPAAKVDLTGQIRYEVLGVGGAV